MNKRKCLYCQTEFDIPTAPTRKDRKKFCSTKCRDFFCNRASAESRGNKLRGTGRPDIYTKYMGQHEHRYVMEKYLGRKLSSYEIVHHIDGDKKNNNISNLVITTRKEHSREHSRKYPVGSTCSVLGCAKNRMTRTYCSKHYQQFKKKNFDI